MVTTALLLTSSAHVPLTTIPRSPSDEQQRWEATKPQQSLPAEAASCPGSQAWVSAGLGR